MAITEHRAPVRSAIPITPVIFYWPQKKAHFPLMKIIQEGKRFWIT